MNGRKWACPFHISKGQTTEAVTRHASTPVDVVRFQSTPAKKIPAKGIMR